MIEPIGIQRPRKPKQHPAVTDLDEAFSTIQEPQPTPEPKPRHERKTWCLTDARVAEIREACNNKSPHDTWTDIARRYGVHPNTLRNIRLKSVTTIRLDDDIYTVLTEHYKNPQRYVNELLRYSLHQQRLL